MHSIKGELKRFLHGDVSDTVDTLAFYSNDASLFEIKPELVVFPKGAEDICQLVNFVNKNHSDYPNLSITPRSGGTDMSGGAINDSIILAFEKYFTRIGEITNQQVSVEPGVYYRYLEPKTLEHNLLLPSYPASREICMIGGMVANDSGGEKSLIYGKTHDYVQHLEIVLRDGKEHVIKPLSGKTLTDKLEEQSFEGEFYRSVHKLLSDNFDTIKAAKPRVSKNSSGYNVWDTWDGQTLDLTKLFVGSQGTLGIITETTFKLIPAKPFSGMMVIMMPTLKNLGEIIKAILPVGPSSLESFDEHTLKFAFRFFYSFHNTLGWKKFILLGISFIPLLNKLLPFMPHFPKIVMLVEFEGDSQEEVDKKISTLVNSMSPFDVTTQLAMDKKHEEKFWIIRRESFNLLRKNVKKKHAAPFIDDLIVPPSTLPDFLPKLIVILEKYKLLYTVAGHMGDGNFHIIPLMDLSVKSERDKIPAIMNEVTDLIVKFGGSLSGEHNDGLIRGPFLNKMYSSQMINIFTEIKSIFDPKNIFNPHKKIGADWEYSKNHIRQHFKN